MKTDLEMVLKNPINIQKVKKPSKELQILAVSKRGYVIKYIKNPDIDVQLEAVKQDGEAIMFIKNPIKECS